MYNRLASARCIGHYFLSLGHETIVLAMSPQIFLGVIEIQFTDYLCTSPWKIGFQLG